MGDDWIEKYLLLVLEGFSFRSVRTAYSFISSPWRLSALWQHNTILTLNSIHDVTPVHATWPVIWCTELQQVNLLKNHRPYYYRVQPVSSVPVLTALTTTRSFKRELFSYLTSYKHRCTLHQDAANRTHYSTACSTTNQHWPSHGSGRPQLISPRGKTGLIPGLHLLALVVSGSIVIGNKI